MDQSYWSQPLVVNATRDFVCIRLATYEDAKETEFLKKIFTGRSGQLENTVFALLDSDGKKRLSKSGRSPDFAFWGRGDFSAKMLEIAKERKLESKRFSDTQLPVIKNVDLALNVASCDRIQLIVVAGKDRQTIDELTKKVLPLAWNEEIGGQFAFTTATRAKELKPLGLTEFKPGIHVVTPGKFGMSGKIVASFDQTLDIGRTKAELSKLAKGYHVEKDYRQHIDAGIQLGIEWETETPVTDQQSLRAKERRRGR